MNNYTITEKTNFNEIVANNGFMLTAYDAENQDIKEYYGTKIVCAPKSVDIAAKYHTITVEEHNALEEEKNKAFEEERKAAEAERLKEMEN